MDTFAPPLRFWLTIASEAFIVGLLIWRFAKRPRRWTVFATAALVVFLAQYVAIDALWGFGHPNVFRWDAGDSISSPNAVGVSFHLVTSPTFETSVFVLSSSRKWRGRARGRPRSRSRRSP